MLLRLLACYLAWFAFGLNAAPLADRVVRIQSYLTTINQVGKSVMQPSRYGTGLHIQGGWILTAAHLVEGSDSIQVTLEGQHQIPAQIHATDPLSDLALLRMASIPGVASTLSFSVPQIGEPVLAYGNPQGEGVHITQGIISFMGLSDQAASPIPRIKTDAQAEPGFSGGPLVNLEGAVVGIITHIDADRKGYTYAIDGATAKLVYQALKNNQPLGWPLLGLTVSATSELEQALSLGLPAGLQVIGIQASSPLRDHLQSASLRSIHHQSIPWGGDILIEIEGHPIATVKDAWRVLWAARQQNSLQIRFQRFSGGQYELHLQP